MPTLLQINVVANWGSTGRIAEEIGQAAKAAGWESYMAYGRYNNPSKSHLVRIGSQWDVYVHYLLQRLFDIEGHCSIRATKRLIKKIDGIKPDVVHLHNIHDHYLNYEILFKYLAEKDIPVVWTQHDCWVFTGSCAYFSRIGCNEWKTGCNRCKVQKAYRINMASSNFQKKLSSFTSIPRMVIVPVSEWLDGLVKQSFLNKYESRVIHNGTDTAIFYPRKSKVNIKEKLNIRAKYILIGVASVWDKRKGLDDFVKLRNRLSQDGFAMILVGLSQKQIDGLPTGIIGISRTNSVDELAEYYSAADLFINPTFEDNFPTTNIEALACGTPVITYRTGGSPEAIDEHTGMIVEQGDVKALANAIHEMTSNGKGFYSDACRQRAEQCFNKFDRWREYVDLYNELINKNIS